MQTTDSEGYFASVKVGVKLGAISARRKQLEAEAANARLEALYEENTGTIWKSGFAGKSITLALANLKKAERELQTAIGELDDTIIRLSDADRSDVVRDRFEARVEKIRIGANLASVRASIRALKDSGAKITALDE